MAFEYKKLLRNGTKLTLTVYLFSATVAEALDRPIGSGGVYFRFENNHMIKTICADHRWYSNLPEMKSLYESTCTEEDFDRVVRNLREKRLEATLS